MELLSIGIVEDPAKRCSGPLWVLGGIAVESAGGEAYEVRNRVTLCRCGASKNKPFCDGTHKKTKDEAADQVYVYDDNGRVQVKNQY